jgi:hypothetical protein
MNIIWIILIVAQIAWLWCLLAHLRNKEIDPTDKICWTVVLCVLNVFGLILFILAGPEETDELESEDDLKRAFNEGRR